ncbi:MAG TPA: DUF5666 domain-containing protein [Blastocatellia bacterium]|nr:DUF5666 domain-containing protein [Blastocatellia bacterium]
MKRPGLFSSLVIMWILVLASAAAAQQVSVSAADYSPRLAAGAIAAAFGAEMASGTAAASGLPLPTKLLGTRVLVNGIAAPLFFVSPGQINYQIPEGVQAGSVEVVIERDGAARSRETISLRSAAFSIFSLNQEGTGTGAIIDGRTFRTGPFNVTTDKGEQTILALFGTGLGAAGSRSFVSSRVHVLVGGVETRVLYAGPHPAFVGLDQINFELPQVVADHGTLPVTVRIDDLPSNAVTIDVPTPNAAHVSLAFSSSDISTHNGSFVIFSPFPDLDSLKITIKLFTIITDQGVEVSLLSVPVTLDLLSPESLSQMIRVANLKPGTYVSLAGEISDVAASYKGQAVAIKLANSTFRQKLAVPLTLDRDTSVGVSLAFNLRASVKKQPDNTYLFDPVLLLNRVLPSFQLPPVQALTGRIVGLDKDSKQLKVQKADATVVVVDASNARIIASNGTLTDFSALATDQKIAVTGSLNAEGVIVAGVIYIGGMVIVPPPVVQPISAIGTITALDRTAKTFELNIESVYGIFIGNLSNLWRTGAKVTVKWNDQTRFRDERSGPVTDAALAVGQRVQVMSSGSATAPPYLASEVVILRPRVQGTIADVTGLPESFKLNAWLDPRLPGPFAPVRIVTVNLTQTTKIMGPSGEDLKTENLVVGNPTDVLCESLSNNTCTAELIRLPGLSFRGSVVPADVKAADSTFVFTQPGTGLRVTVKTDDKSVLVLRSGTGKTQLKPDEFYKLLQDKPYAVEVNGIFIAPNTIRAATVVIE